MPSPTATACPALLAQSTPTRRTREARSDAFNLLPSPTETFTTGGLEFQQAEAAATSSGFEIREDTG
eukprot:75443-Hanusia_phi.AAC.1